MTTKEILPMLVILIGIVMLMAGMGGRGLAAGRSILFVIAGFLLLALLFGTVVARAL
jgi:hypothetical protein